MNNESGDLRSRLLELEPLNPDLSERFHKEILTVFEQKLTGGWKVFWLAGFFAALVFMGWGALVAIAGDIDPFLRVVWALYATANLAFSVYAVSVLRKGALDLRQLFSVLLLAPVGGLLIAVVLYARAAALQTNEAMLWASFGGMCLMIALFWALFNRLTRVELANREQLLRLELRLLELAERLDKDPR